MHKNHFDEMSKKQRRSSLSMVGKATSKKRKLNEYNMFICLSD